MTDAERERRIYHHLYETCEGIAEHAERIASLEELVAELYPMASDLCDTLPSCTSCRMRGDDGCLLNGVQDRIKELEVPL